ncbi:MAG: cytochrome C oxidase subunit IV family protein [Zoogloeaceae bacterium]|nr:cytochrome C oxidase subunit IV family protein [Zoogloeaceae bacterium]
MSPLPSEFAESALPSRRLDGAWGLLLAATFATWMIGDFDQGAARMPLAAMAAVAVITFVKGRVVVLDFMGLRRVSLFWRGLLLGWLIFVLGLVALAYGLGL